MNRSPAVSQVLMLGLGILLIFVPGLTMNTVVRIAGVVLLATGVLVTVSSVRDPERAQFRIYDTFWGVAMILLGFVILREPARIVSVFPKMMGAVIFVNGMINFMSVRKGQLGRILAVISIIMGFMIFLNPFGTMKTVMRFIGIGLVYNALLGTFLRKIGG